MNFHCKIIAMTDCIKFQFFDTHMFSSVKNVTIGSVESCAPYCAAWIAISLALVQIVSKIFAHLGQFLFIAVCTKKWYINNILIKLTMPDKNKQKQPQANPQQAQKQQQHAPKENHEQSHAKEEKEMRKIQQRQQMPTDKAELIQYLSERIKQAQQALNDTQQVLQTETAQRQKIAKAIQERNTQLAKLYEVDQKALPQKIKEKLTQILTQTINQKLQAQEELHQQKQKNYEYKTRYQELKWQQQRLKQKIDELASKQSNFNKEISQRQTSISEHQNELKDYEEEFQTVKQKKQALQNKYLQMKVALERMSDIKAVLNRFFANQDLFDQKMDLKQQKITRPQIHEPQSVQKIEARQPSRQNRNSTKLKPLNSSRRKEVADDEDFWKGDFSAKTRNF